MAMGGGLAICGRGLAGLSLASGLMPEEGAFPSPDGASRKRTTLRADRALPSQSFLESLG